MESNISRDHIALEAMKIIIETSFYREETLWNKIRALFGFGHNATDCIMKGTVAAKRAYEYADAMIEEREKREKML